MDTADAIASTSAPPALSPVVIHLLKGVLYRDDNAPLWRDLLVLQPQVRDYVAVLGLELVLDPAEGYAFLRSRPADEDDANRTPRLVARRPLSFPVSLLLALLRRKLVEFDASGGETRLVLEREEIVELMRVFLPDTSNEARLIDQIETHINRVVELGFLRRLKPTPGSDAPPGYEVRRIIKAFVDAQWLAAFEARLVQAASASEDTTDD
ncbi:DUF4194 domain-containing protein [Marichromatium gracile]|uniref:DUF4194 domain-containing protein n=1 Tax=Marichromatium gracile TaxID=1048 RepID=UPI001F2C49BA|nr:DUF4194 domain-containing protein [Marichromatium gracile]MCF1184234.1 DUF4194 domain-containing protein [Marichromatium gracile]